MIYLHLNLNCRLLSGENKENVGTAVNKKRKHVTLTLEQKLEVIEQLDVGKTSLEKIARRFNVCKSTVLYISRNRDSIRTTESRYRESGVSGRRTTKTARSVDLEEALFVWMLQERNKHNYARRSKNQSGAAILDVPGKAEISERCDVHRYKWVV